MVESYFVRSQSSVRSGFYIDFSGGVQRERYVRALVGCVSANQ